MRLSAPTVVLALAATFTMSWANDGDVLRAGASIRAEYTRISKSQNPVDCGEITAVRRVNAVARTGLGVTLQHFVSLLLTCVENREILVIEEIGGQEWLYGKKACSNEASWECFFKPPSKCKMADLTNPSLIVTNVTSGQAPIRDHIEKVEPSDYHLMAAWAFLLRLNLKTVELVHKVKELIELGDGSSFFTAHVRQPAINKGENKNVKGNTLCGHQTQF